ncbi:MAG TPA: 50S ribosomal protein L25 [Polyangiaceae bacterium]|nr:50S ribosomal protein L25 [Polyangiaceae bacterium]
METIKVVANRRTESGKGAASRLRASGKIPAVAYGKQLPAQPLAVSPDALKAVFASAYGNNAVIELDVEGKDKLTVLLRDYQYHPLSRQLLHADFVQVHMDQPVDVEVPLELTGKPAGLLQGGILRQVFRKLPIRSLPGNIPVKVVHDVTSLELDGHVATKDLNLPEGVSVRLPAEQTVAAIVHEVVREEETAAPAAGAAAANTTAANTTPAAGAAAAPAAGGKAPAAGAKAPDKK